MSLNDVLTSAQTLIRRDGVCQNLSFQNIFNENFCKEIIIMLETIIILLLKTKYNTLSLWSYERLKTCFQTSAQEICANLGLFPILKQQ